MKAGIFKGLKTRGLIYGGWVGTGNPYKMKSGSMQAEKHPYLRAVFWLNPENHFWKGQKLK